MARTLRNAIHASTGAIGVPLDKVHPTTKCWAIPLESQLACAALVSPTTVGAADGDAPLRDKTLVVWVAPANLTQSGGSALTVNDTTIDRFDAVEESAGCQPAVVDARAAKERGDDAVGAIVTPRAPGAVAPDDGAVGVGPDAALHRVAAGHRSV